MLEALTTAVEELALCPVADEVASAVALWEMLGAKVALAVGELDALGGWEADGSVSAAAWLRSRCQMTSSSATRLASTGRRLHRLPACAQAAATGVLSGGQVAAVLAGLNDATVAQFAAQEAELLPVLAPLSVPECARAMAAWAAHADPEGSEPTEASRSLHCSPTLAGRYELKGSLDPEGGSVVATALRVAFREDREGEAIRRPATRRADALVDICRFFLERRDDPGSTRHRPHLSVVVDLDDLVAAGSGSVVDGAQLDGATISSLACDSSLHRVVMAGRSAVLDYGTATRTISTSLWNALVIRDEHCRFPGCDRPSWWCEGHHVVWFTRGGATSLDNLALLCSRHHHLLHLPGWQAKLAPDGTLEVTDPGGGLRTTSPPRAGPRLW